MPRWRRVWRLPWLRWWRVCWLPRLRRVPRLPWLRRLRVRWHLVRWLRGLRGLRGLGRGLLRILGSVPLVLSPTKRADVTVSRSLPVYPDEQTNSVSTATSQKCAKAAFRRPVFSACARRIEADADVRGQTRPLAFALTANGMVRPCSCPASKRSWQGAPKTRSTPCLRHPIPRSP